MQIAKWEWKKLLRDWKTRLLLLAFFIFYATFSLLYQQQSVTFPEEELEKRYENIHQFFNSVPSSEFAGEVEQEVYANLSELQLLYGMQRYILSQQEGNTVRGFENIFADYFEYGIQIAENQERLLELEEFPYYDYLRKFLPDETTIRKDVAFYDYMKKHDLNVEWNSFSASNVLVEEVNLMLGFSLFLFIALLAGDRFTKDQTRYWSITHGLPISWQKQWHLRTAQLWVLIWVISFAGLLISYLFSLLLETPGSLHYPVLIYTSSGFVPIAIWQYTLVALGLGMLLSFFLLLLTVGMSWIFRTIYLTMLITMGVYFFPFLWQARQPFSSWQPSLYLHIEPVLLGTLAAATGLPDVSFWKGIVLLMVLILILEVIFFFVFDRIQTQTLGLKRRTRP